MAAQQPDEPEASGIPDWRMLRAHDEETEEVREALHIAYCEIRHELEAAGFRAPRTLKDWDRLARIIERDPRVLWLGEIHEETLAWLERERIRNRLAAAAAGRPVTDVRSELPELGPHDHQAWQLVTFLGKTQSEAADELNSRFGTSYAQPTISKMIARCRKLAAAGGLRQLEPPTMHAVDPATIDRGARVDQHTPRQRAAQK